MKLTQEEKEEITEVLHNEYNPTFSGQIERYPPEWVYFVTLYYENEFSFAVENRYNVDIAGNTYDILMSNTHKAGKDIGVTVKIQESK